MTNEDTEVYFDESIKELTKSPADKALEKKQTQQVFQAVKMFETNIIESKNQRIKWLGRLSGFLGVAVVALAIAIASLAPLKSVIPFLLRVDSTTGYVDKLEPYSTETATVDESVTRYFLARFVENREGYDWYTIQSMYDFVESTSDRAIFEAYKSYMVNEELSPLKRLANRSKIQVKVNGITFLNDSTAQIRFTKMISDLDGKPAVGFKPSKWIATVTFDLSKKINTEQARLINPLGLSVTSYRVDAEVIK
ncbi:virB8 family protein [Xenorhabdus bovienii]|uniref:virB8 family protein n=1 Tax=Xenorhabdus bovienii TaxID=40576 RepID=UPI002156FA3A|nr:type IV secretion system protein [Xenorhabdus bovienii]